MKTNRYLFWCTFISVWIMFLYLGEYLFGQSVAWPMIGGHAAGIFTTVVSHVVASEVIENEKKNAVND